MIDELKKIYDERIFFEIEEDGPEKKIKLDDKFEKMLILLNQDSMMSSTLISDKIKLSKESVRLRINDLIHDKQIWPTVELNLDSLGLKVVCAYFQTKEMSLELKQKFLKNIFLNRVIYEYCEFSDIIDFEIKAVIPKSVDIAEIIDDVYSTISDKIIDVDIYEIKEEIISRNIPFLLDSYNEYHHLIPQKKKDAENGSKINACLLNLLINNSRERIIDMLGVLNERNISNVLYHKKRIMSSDYVKNAIIKINLTNFGYHQYRILLNLNEKEDKKDFIMFLKSNRSVTEFFKMIGSWNYVISFCCVDISVLHLFLKEMRHRFYTLLNNFDVLIVYKRAFVPIRLDEKEVIDAVDE